MRAAGPRQPILNGINGLEEVTHKVGEWLGQLFCLPDEQFPLGLQKGEGVEHLWAQPGDRPRPGPGLHGLGEQPMGMGLGMAMPMLQKQLAATAAPPPGVGLPVGSLKVRVDDGHGEKVVPPEEARQMMRLLPRPATARPGATPRSRGRGQAQDQAHAQGGASGRATPSKAAPVDEGQGQVGDMNANTAGPSHGQDELAAVTRACQLAGRPFTDRSFRLGTNSKVTEVLRPGQIARHEGRPTGKAQDWQLFRGRPRVDDVQQGEIGDCWFLSALAVMADFEEGRLLHALLPGQNAISSVGAYKVRLCLGGRWREILVDDLLPCIGGGLYYTQLAFCVTKRQQLWASLIEKAFAKVCGSYEAIRGGEASESLEMLTGWPCTMAILQQADFNPEKLWATLLAARASKYLMICSTKKVHSRSLEADHVYSLLDVQEVQDRKGERRRLLKIRNPHDGNKWDGDWSDRSPLWTPELRQQMGYPSGGASPQVFVMSYDDFVREFAHCTICRIRGSRWHEQREPLRLPGSGEVPCMGLELEASEVTECCISLVQPSVRLKGGPFAAQNPGPLACLGFVLLPMAEAGKANASAAALGQLQHSATVSSDCTLPQGRYLLVPLARHQGPQLEATWAVMSSQKVQLKERQLDSNTLRQAWAAYVRERDPVGIPFHGATLRLGKSDGGAVVAYAENPTDRYLQVQLAFRSQNMRFSRGAMEIFDWLSPRSCQIVQFAQPVGMDESGKDISPSWQHSHTLRMTPQGPTTQLHTPPLRGGDLHAPFGLSRASGAPECAQQ